MPLGNPAGYADAAQAAEQQLQGAMAPPNPFQQAQGQLAGQRMLAGSNFAPPQAPTGFADARAQAAAQSGAQSAPDFATMDAVTSQLRAPSPAQGGSFQPLQGDARAAYTAQVDKAQAGMPKMMNETASLGRPQAPNFAAGPSMAGNPSRGPAPMGQPGGGFTLGAPGMNPMQSAMNKFQGRGGKNAPAPGGFGNAPAPGRGKGGGVPSQFRSIR
jgi:hypothetical protein